MKNIKISNKGFTLIELLVVVAIIGILASVVLAFLNSARAKGDDAAVKTNLRTVANQAEIFYLNNGNSYLPIAAAPLNNSSSFTATALLAARIRPIEPGPGPNPIAPCPNGTNMFSEDPIIAEALAEAIKRGDGSSCYNSANIWTAAVGLKVEPNTSWCVDVSGAAKLEGPVSSAINPSTLLCN